jgi:hypothetical protein
MIAYHIRSHNRSVFGMRGAQFWDGNNNPMHVALATLADDNAATSTQQRSELGQTEAADQTRGWRRSAMTDTRRQADIGTWISRQGSGQ